jgi:hypothetical protein
MVMAQVVQAQSQLTVVHSKTWTPEQRAKWLADNTKPRTFTDGNGMTLTLVPREFSTGSVGWYYSGKASV